MLSDKRNLVVDSLLESISTFTDKMKNDPSIDKIVLNIRDSSDNIVASVEIKLYI